ncbi:uncharacterized protein METZ01_LOCUS3234 [marine metagenome]|uniref:Uncharacterized protein n=1 Tax=marine metagenome TaxID=408172 RepID=A0A381N6W8_9ZZZZ
MYSSKTGYIFYLFAVITKLLQFTQPFRHSSIEPILSSKDLNSNLISRANYRIMDDKV